MMESILTVTLEWIEWKQKHYNIDDYNDMPLSSEKTRNLAQLEICAMAYCFQRPVLLRRRFL